MFPHRREAWHAAFFEQSAHGRATPARRDEADVRRAAPESRFERLLVVMPLRRHDDRAVGRAVAENRLERVERRDVHAEGRGLRLDVAFLASLDDSCDPIVQAARNARERIGHGVAPTTTRKRA